MKSAPLSSREKALLCLSLVREKKAENPRLLDMQSTSPIADYILVCSGNSDRQVRAIADSVRIGLKERGCPDIGSEGYTEGKWILIDYGDVVVHIFCKDVREFYDIESLCPYAVEIKD